MPPSPLVNRDLGDGIDARLLDLRDFPMPFFDQPVTPATPGRPAFEHEVVQRRAAAIAQSDGFVVVTPEYNYGPAATNGPATRLKSPSDLGEILKPFGGHSVHSTPAALRDAQAHLAAIRPRVVQEGRL